MAKVRSRLRKIKVLRNIKRSLLGPRLPPHLQGLEDIEGMISLQEADLLFRLARNTRDGCIMEIGSYRGRSTVALARGSLAGSRAAVFAVDPHETFRGALGGSFGPEDRGAFYQTMLNTAAYRIVRLVNLGSEIIAPGWQIPVGLLWIDGDHTYEGVLRDWRFWSSHLTRRCRVAFDDAVNPDLGPKRLIEEVIENEGFRMIEFVGKVAVLGRESEAIEERLASGGLYLAEQQERPREEQDLSPPREARTFLLPEALCRRLEVCFATDDHPDASAIVRVLVEEVLESADDRLQRDEEELLVQRLKELGYL